jgi:hypothetical protein
MAQVVRYRPSVLAVIGELVAYTMSQHVGMDREGKFCGFACPLHHP